MIFPAPTIHFLFYLAHLKWWVRISFEHVVPSLRFLLLREIHYEKLKVRVLLLTIFCRLRFLSYDFFQIYDFLVPCLCDEFYEHSKMSYQNYVAYTLIYPKNMLIAHSCSICKVPWIGRTPTQNCIHALQNSKGTVSGTCKWQQMTCSLDCWHRGGPVSPGVLQVSSIHIWTVWPTTAHWDRTIGDLAITVLPSSQ